ncbi:MAG: tol-pal system protein YbgF [Proteobacteria bacterium]|nr:tol-pal system protein YbgF [Pseudomonadota bacterium]
MKNRLCKSVCLLALLFFFVSCGSMNYFKKGPGNKDPQTAEQISLSRVESELSDIKQDQKNLTLQMEAKDTTIVKLQDNILNLEKKIALLEKNTPPVAPIQYKIEYTNPAVLYGKARTLLIEDNFLNAATLFTEFIKQHPDHSLADNAVYWLGECHYSLGDYEKAILVFKDLETKYPASEKVPDAILKLGYSYLSVNDTNRAHHYLKKVLKKYPFSPAAEKAQEKLRSFE